MEPVAGATVLELDFLAPEAPAAIMAALGGGADVVLSDMAAPTTGHAPTDHIRIVALAETAYDFAKDVLAPGGAFIAKVFQGGTENELLTLLKHDFATVRHAKPPASRAESAEVYVVAQGFKAADSGPITAAKTASRASLNRLRTLYLIANLDREAAWISARRSLSTTSCWCLRPRQFFPTKPIPGRA